MSKPFSCSEYHYRPASLEASGGEHPVPAPVHASPHKPSAKQQLFLNLTCLEALYGGAAGGGKSEALLMAALQFVHVPGYAALILRKDTQRLQLAGGLIPRSHEWLANSGAVWNASRRQWTFPSGATITFGYLSNWLDKYRYGSSEFQFIAFDELTEFTEEDYLFLFSRLRKVQQLHVPLRMRSASNPGGIGHVWVKGRFVEARGQESGVRSQVEEIAGLLGIEKLLARKPGELSGGEQQRVALGRALVRQPAAMLLDEPLSSLDPPLRSELRRLLKELQQRLKVTTVYVTHDQGEAMSLGERIAVIKEGKIEQVGTPAEIYDEPRNRFVAGFFGEGMNWGGRSQGSGVRGQQSVLGVRPEDVVLRRGGGDGRRTGTVTGTQWLGPATMVEVDLEKREETEQGIERVTWLSRVCGRADFRVGEKVSIEVAPGKEHWFDLASGERTSVNKI